MRGLWGSKEKKSVGAALIVLEGKDKGEEFTIADQMSIGRTQENSLVRVERGVSRQHCSIRDEGGVFTIEDLNSSNGTLVNDKKIEGLEVLRHGDRIVIGETTYLFHWPDGEVDAGLSTSPGMSTSPGAGGGGDDTQPGGQPQSKAKKFDPKDIKALLKRPPILAAVGLSVIIFFVLVSLLFCGDDAVLGPSDLSDQPVRYSDSSEFRNTAFGYGPYDTAHPDKVIIHFEYLKGRVLLRYSAWGIDERGEVVVTLNSKQIGDVPTTQEYRHENIIEFPQESLQDGVNEVVFDNLRNPPGEDGWEVAYVRIIHEPLLPANPDEAQSLYQQGMRLYEDRDLDPANRFRAYSKFRMTRSLLVQANPRPPHYDEATTMMERVADELQDKYERGRFSAERAYRFGDIEKARDYLRRTIRYFPEGDDIRREQLEGMIHGLEGQ